MTNVWIFTTSTKAAYDASQTNPDIKDGDVLIVPNEGVVGFLYKAWPIATTTDTGHFHPYEDNEIKPWESGPEYDESFQLANWYISEDIERLTQNGKMVRKTRLILNETRLSKPGAFRILTPIEL